MSKRLPLETNVVYNKINFVWNTWNIFYSLQDGKEQVLHTTAQLHMVCHMYRTGRKPTKNTCDVSCWVYLVRWSTIFPYFILVRCGNHQRIIFPNHPVSKCWFHSHFFSLGPIPALRGIHQTIMASVFCNLALMMFGFHLLDYEIGKRVLSWPSNGPDSGQPHKRSIHNCFLYKNKEDWILIVDTYLNGTLQ